MKRVLVAALLVTAACSDLGSPGASGVRLRSSATGPGVSGDTTGRSSRGVTVTPSSSTVAPGDTTAFSAVVRNGRGNVVSDARVTWSIDDPTVARIEQTSGQTVIVRALRQGTTLVSASSRGGTGTARLVVTDSAPPPPPPGDSVATVTVTPDSAIVPAGDTTSFVATLRDSSGTLLSGRLVSWSTSDSTVARIEAIFGSTVVIRALASGSSLVTASSEGRSGSAIIVVP